MADACLEPGVKQVLVQAVVAKTLCRQCLINKTAAY